MNKEILKGHKKNKKELAIVNVSLDKLYEKLNEVPVVSGKVMKSDDEFPYIGRHVTVEMQEPKTATELKQKIRKKEARKKVLQSEIKEVEDFIASMPEGMNKQICEMIFLDGEKQRYVADLFDITQGRISQIIREIT